MIYHCYYFLTPYIGKKQDLIEFLRKEKGEMFFINNYNSLPEFFQNPAIPPEGVIVLARLSSEKDAYTLRFYLKSLGQVKQVVMHGPHSLPGRKY